MFLDFMEIALRGYTVRRIRELMEERGHDLTNVPDAYLVNLLRENAPQLEAARDALDATTVKRFGLASKLERVRRLCEAAESIEIHRATHPKWMAEYRKVLQQIQTELEPLGIEVSVGDGWAQLMTKLTEVGQQGVDESDASAEEADN
jgi:hypothetical protein